MHSLFGAMTPRRLGLTSKSLIGIDPRDPMFSFLTHLLIDHNGIPSHLITYMSTSLSHLPALTHLAMCDFELRYPSSCAATEKAILTTCKGLRVLVVDPETIRLEGLPSVDDVRFIYMKWMGDLRRLIEGWVAETRGGIDFWARADAFVAKRRRGEILPASRCWIEVDDGI
ncbi:hypothetical protein MVEN_00256200 [Mycena venus]|uniref:Uncharacterized protein n=1 Tax=Mycena venus TaxID=2733690 RepID=A0A8H6Z1N1_9AGAR|nr:hypothetical protein MVEN_00256200 [Mycena venus]